ncbi:MAG: thioredoxin domain-containing protein [Chitinispirillales bacterium]|jgi:protein-disulfide isomerase|nr:thioredoxin domain-containing protein [Chitinispirillales bacterium]
MKRISIAACSFLLVFTMSCVKQEETNNSELAAELAEVKSVLSHFLERRMNSSFEQIKSEIERENVVWDLRIDESPSRGSPDAKITIVEFSTFECPFSARIAPLMDSIATANPDKIRIVYKHFLLNMDPNAPAAVAASMAAEKQGKFWEYRLALSPHVRNLNDSTFIAAAEQVGLDMEQFKIDMILDDEKQAVIDRDKQLGIEVGVQGTPNFYVNGKRQPRFGPDIIEKMLLELYPN